MARFTITSHGLASFLLLAAGSGLTGCPPAPPSTPGPTPAPGTAVTVVSGTATPAQPAMPTPPSVTTGSGAAPSGPAVPDRATALTKGKKAIDLGLRWCRAQQAEDGSYGNHPGITAMVVTAFLQSPRKYREADGPFVRLAIEYLTRLAKPNGAIFDKNLPTYNTALALLALQATENPDHQPLIAKGQAFLAGLQLAEQNQRTPQDKEYGGIGYGDKETPDLSNLQYALEALSTTGYGNAAVFQRATKFIERCQNRSESNDLPWAGNDGGFIYAPGTSKAGQTTSYGSMTYAGILSLMYANVGKHDPRVQDAFKWVKAHWDLATHPGMGDVGLYFYYQTLAKALRAYGEPVLVDDQGRNHDWAVELIDTLAARQAEDGSWVNSNPEYWEGNKLLTTARAVQALESAVAMLTAAEAPQAPAAPPAATTPVTAPPASTGN